MNLYEISVELVEALGNITVDESTGEIKGYEALDALNASFEEKLEGMVCRYKNLKAMETAILNEKNNLDQIRRSVKSEADRIEKCIKFCMERVGKSKVVTPKSMVYFRSSQSVEVDDISLIPEEYLRFKEPEAKKDYIAKAIKAGEEIPGVHIVEKQNIQIK